MPWLTTEGPDLALLEVAQRLADQRDLLLLDSGGSGWAYAAWGMKAQRLRGLDDLPAATDGVLLWSDAEGWPQFGDGGRFIQLDYEFPVGPWALERPGRRRVQGRSWAPTGFVVWPPQGRCRLHARDAAMLQRLAADLARPPVTLLAPRLREPFRPAWDAAGHAARVAAIKDLIAAGDIYQANLTLPFNGRLRRGRHQDLAIFERLRSAAPGGFAAFLRCGRRTVVSHSPECFLLCDGQRLVSRPIKGTRPRQPGSDIGRRTLAAAAKDHAELTMIVDLVRNDLGRVARPGSVRVGTSHRLLDLAYVHHLVAEISAVPRAGLGLRELLAAAFPAGSITGAPKIRAMRIILDLEANDRGPYCGTFGWYGAGAACALAVAIRTLVIQGDAVRLDAGGGIVADSDGDEEWRELLAKAGPMLAACGGVAD